MTVKDEASHKMTYFVHDNEKKDSYCSRSVERNEYSNHCRRRKYAAPRQLVLQDLQETSKQRSSEKGGKTKKVTHEFMMTAKQWVLLTY